MASSSRSGRGKGNKRDKGNGWEESGGYMAAKIKKLANQFTEEKKDSANVCKSSIFDNISIFVNGYTKPSSDALKRLMQQHGGTYHHYYSRSKVTHIIASNLPNSKVANITDKKVVHTDWITESIKANKLLPYQDFLLYKAETKRQPSIKFARPSDISESTASADSGVQHEEADFETEYQSENAVAEEVSCDRDQFEDAMDDGTATDRTPKESKQEKLLSPTQRSPAKAGDPNFVSQFYGRSRLHHISTWGSEMKAYVKKLQAQPSDFEARQKLIEIVKQRPCSENENESDKVSQSRVIMHVDMDSFFVSVGLRNKPELLGKPVAVTHCKGSNATSKAAEKAGYQGSMAEIASCSYEARKCGVKNGMFMGPARQLCPDLLTIPYDFDGYSQVSHQLYDLVSSYTHDIEAVSCDEMMVDLTELLADTGASPLEFAALLRQEIKAMTKCNASAGLGSNILLARLATTKAKPNGQLYVCADEAAAFMQDIPVRSLPGVGRKLADKLVELGVTLCSDLQQVPLATLQKDIGNKTGQMLHNYCRGKDERVIQTEKARKSVSAEINYGIRFTQQDEAERFVGELAEEVAKRLVAISTRGKHITLKLKVRSKHAPVETAKYMGHGICDNVAKSVTLASMTDDASVVAKETVLLLRSLHVPVADIRGMGIQMTKLDFGGGGESGVTSVAGMRSILQFTTKMTKPPVQQLSTTEEKPVPTESPIKIPEPQPRSLPPLPSLDLSSQRVPLLQFDDEGGRGVFEEAEPVTSAQHATTASNRGNTYWPSASQIDEGVLRELPPDIQAEIRQQMKSKQSRAHVSQQDGGKVDEGFHTSQEAGCSHWTPPVPTVHASPVKMPVFKQAPATPKKGRSPKKSPAKGRGRPKKVAPVRHRSPPRPSVTVPSEDQGQAEHQDAEAEPAKSAAEEVSLCGATSLPDVKLLLQQWLQDSPEPCADDVERFVQYASALVQAHNMEQLVLLLRHLRRIARKRNEMWIKSVEDITHQTKMVVQSFYGSELKV